MLQQRGRGELLIGAQVALKRHLQWLSAVALVTDDGADMQARQDLTNIVSRGAARCDGDVLRRKR